MTVATATTGALISSSCYCRKARVMLLLTISMVITFLTNVTMMSFLSEEKTSSSNLHLQLPHNNVVNIHNDSLLTTFTNMMMTEMSALHHAAADESNNDAHARNSSFITSSYSMRKTTSVPSFNDDEQVVVSEDDDSDNDDFFDCHSNKSKCTYFYPGEFYKHYFENVLSSSIPTTTLYAVDDNTTMTKNNDAYYNYHDKNNTIHEERTTKMKDRIGLNNANLPALTAFSWWWTSDDSRNISTTAIVDRILLQQHQYNLLFVKNITYIHVHKCGGTSIQGALYRRARYIRNMNIQLTMDNNVTNHQENAEHPHPYYALHYNHDHRQNNNNNTSTMENREDNPHRTTVFLQEKEKLLLLHANVRAYRHSFGGGSPQKKELWDNERLHHIHAIHDSQQQQSWLSSSSSSYPTPFVPPLEDQRAVPLMDTTDSTTTAARQRHSSFQSSHSSSSTSTSSSSSSHIVFTIVRDPIERFLSAIQQVMQYNMEFRQKCLYEEDDRSDIQKSNVNDKQWSTVHHHHHHQQQQQLSSLERLWSILFPWRSSSTAGYEKEEDILLDNNNNNNNNNNNKDDGVIADDDERQKVLRQRTIQCSIQDMEQTSYRKDVHLQPMASHFRLFDIMVDNDEDDDEEDVVIRTNDDDDDDDDEMIVDTSRIDADAATRSSSARIPRKNRYGINNNDDDDDDDGTSSITTRTANKRGIAVSVFSMQDIHHVLNHLLSIGNNDRRSNNNSNSNSNITNTNHYLGSLSTTTTLHMRDRSNVEYATSPILSRLSLDDCDEIMIRQICTLYHVDVEMMKWLGLGGEAVERCVLTSNNY